MLFQNFHYVLKVMFAQFLTTPKAMPIKVSCVSYLNTKPFIHGLEKTGLLHDIDLILEMPSQTAKHLQNKDVRVGLVPVATIPAIPNARIITNFCIGAVGAVKTVSLYAQQPLETLTHILLDYQSRTSVQLVQMLCRQFWHLPYIRFTPAQPGYEQMITGSTGGVIIGDRTIDWAPKFAFEYDLSQAWHQFTGLPFVFAAWVTTGNLPAGFESRLNESFKAGMEAIDEVAEKYQPMYSPNFDVKAYFSKYISYQLDEEKLKGLDLFWRYVKENTLAEAI